MMRKKRPDLKPTAAKPNTIKKRGSTVQDTDKKTQTSLLKKNEFTLIIFGALLLTLIIFFLFFRSSDSNTEPFDKISSSDGIAQLEKRIKALEQAIAVQKEPGQAGIGKNTTKAPEDDPLKDRVTRLETAFSVKFDSVIDQIATIERKISTLKAQKVEAAAPKTKPKTIIPVKKAVKKETATAMFHTVLKGETLYSISKKYNTSVPALRKLNNLSATAKIYPGNNILIR